VSSLSVAGAAALNLIARERTTTLEENRGMNLPLETRLLLANQYRLLELSAPDEGIREHYRNAVTILERGYELEYHTITDSFFEPMSEEECREVYDILEMLSDLKFAYGEVGEASGVDEVAISFRGFDGNNEAKWLAYASFLMTELGKWADLAPARRDGLNSHMPMLGRYRAMLRVWRPVRENHISNFDATALTSDEIKQIADAR
jgi:uncharacterized protein YfbU (UPF0304 family)